MRYFFIFLLGMFLIISSCGSKSSSTDAKYFYTIDSYKNFPVTYRPRNK